MRVTIGRGSRRISVTLIHPSRQTAEGHEANVRELCVLLGLYPRPQ